MIPALGLRRRELGPEAITALVGGAVVVVVSSGFFAFAGRADPDTWVPMVVVWCLAVISLPICWLLTRSPRDVRLRRLLILSFVLKMLAVGPRFLMAEVIFEGEGDAGRYHNAGQILVDNMAKEGKFSIEGSSLNAFPRETRVVGYLAGSLFLLFGTSYIGAFFVFSWVSWLGLLLALRAFQVAFPNAPPYRAALLILFLPSVLFWPSSLGKDALMIGVIGLMALGAARFLTGRKPLVGVMWMGISGMLMLQIRPHLLLISALALACSQLAVPEGSVSKRGIGLRVVVLIALVPILVTGIGRVDALLGANWNDDIAGSLDETARRTAIGGSAFSAVPVRTPIDLPGATVTVLYRPFLFEARSVGVAVSAIEGVLLLLMTVLSAGWIWRIGPTVSRNAFGAFCGVYVLGFIVAFSNISNAGILSRQRTQLYPLLMIVVAAAYETHRIHRRELADLADAAAVPRSWSGHPAAHAAPAPNRPSAEPVRVLTP